MSALAGLLKSRGCVVEGSDVAAYPPAGDLLKAQQIPVHLNFEASTIEKFRPDYVVIGNFVRRDNPQAQWVMDQKIPHGSFPSTLENEFLTETTNLVVTGTHGKTTTTTATAFLLDRLGRKPGFLIGGAPMDFDTSFQWAGGKEFVLEGDEYDTAFFDKESKFLHYRPSAALLHSLEYDHADIFPTTDSMLKMFEKFVGLIPPSGALFANADWPLVAEVLKRNPPRATVKTYGFSPTAEIAISNFSESATGIRFEAAGVTFESGLSGRYNAANLLGAALLGTHVGISFAEAARVLKNFRGVKRRQEVRYSNARALVIDDFAHHPTAVREVIASLKIRYPDRKLVTLFEPRSNTSRRNIFQKEYEDAFSAADLTLLAPVFRAEALADGERLDLKKIEAAMTSRGRDCRVNLSKEELIEACLAAALAAPSVFLILSNGSFDGLHGELISRLQAGVM